jgi:hypothetical protein
MLSHKDEQMSIPFTKQNKRKTLKAIAGGISYKCLSSSEWHQFVQNYNYDGGIKPFEWLVKQKTCDKGTALCLYWYLDPLYFHSERFKNFNSPHYKLIKKIEDGFAAGFYENEEFSYEPSSEFLPKNADTHNIPKIMLQNTNGVLFERAYIEEAFLRAPNEKDLKTMEKRISNAIAILRLIDDPKYLNDDTDKTVAAIENAVIYFKDKDIGKMKINDLSFLWLDCIAKKYGWSWVMWDWETGAKHGVSNKSKSLTCMANMIIEHIISGLQEPQIITQLYLGLADEKKINTCWSGIVLLSYTGHLEFRA